jgi:hypothetical protein
LNLELETNLKFKIGAALYYFGALN